MPLPKHPKRVVPYGEILREPTAKERSVAHENHLARVTGGRVQPRSGAGEWKKGDVTQPFFLIEGKTTKAKGFRVTYADLMKIRSHALEADREPMFEVTFEGREHADWAVVPLDVLMNLLEGR